MLYYLQINFSSACNTSWTKIFNVIVPEYTKALKIKRRNLTCWQQTPQEPAHTKQHLAPQSSPKRTFLNIFLLEEFSVSLSWWFLIFEKVLRFSLFYGKLKCQFWDTHALMDYTTINGKRGVEISIKLYTGCSSDGQNNP